MKFNALQLERVVERIQRDIDCDALPGAVLAVGHGQDTEFRTALGFAEKLDGVVRPMTEDTIFDLASLTKVISALPSVLSLIDRGELRLTDPVGRYIPEFSDGRKSSITLKHLLTHTSGLISHRAYYDMYTSRDEMLDAIHHEELVNDPDTTVVYSDLGFIILGEIAHKVSGLPLDEYAKRHVFQPLGMASTTYLPSEELRSRIAATEKNGPGGTVKIGIVHDENTCTLGGVSGHAGLFAPVADLERYVKMWLSDESDVLSIAARHMAVQCHTSHLDGRRGLGWTYRRDGYDHTGDLWPETSVMHTGFTGTSVAFDPVSKLWAILLTNHVHYGREKAAIIRLRAVAHNMIAAAVTEWR